MTHITHLATRGTPTKTVGRVEVFHRGAVVLHIAFYAQTALSLPKLLLRWLPSDSHWLLVAGRMAGCVTVL